MRLFSGLESGCTTRKRSLGGLSSSQSNQWTNGRRLDYSTRDCHKSWSFFQDLMQIFHNSSGFRGSSSDRLGQGKGRRVPASIARLKRFWKCDSHLHRRWSNRRRRIQGCYIFWTNLCSCASLSCQRRLNSEPSVSPQVLRERNCGYGILVSQVPKDTEAFYSLRDPSEVISSWSLHFFFPLVSFNLVWWF